MQITIDTKHDSPAEIKKAIQLLQSLAGESTVYSNTSYESSQSPMANFFDTPSPPSNPLSYAQSSPPSQSESSNPMSSLLSIFGDDKPAAPSQSQSATPSTNQSQFSSGNDFWSSLGAAKSVEQEKVHDLPKVVPYDDDPLGSHAQRLLDQSKIGEDPPKIKPLKINFSDHVTEYY